MKLEVVKPLASILSISVFFLLIGCSCEPEETFITRESQIEKQFSGWDGSHMNLESWIKDNMNDPKSYEHVESGYIDKGSYLIIKTEYRGKNAFGGTVKGSVKAKVDIEGNIIEIMESL